MLETILFYLHSVGHHNEFYTDSHPLLGGGAAVVGGGGVGGGVVTVGQSSEHHPQLPPT